VLTGGARITSMLILVGAVVIVVPIALVSSLVVVLRLLVRLLVLVTELLLLLLLLLMSLINILLLCLIESHLVLQEAHLNFILHGWSVHLLLWNCLLLFFLKLQLLLIEFLVE